MGVFNALLRQKLWIWIHSPQPYVFLSVKRSTKELIESGFAHLGFSRFHPHCLGVGSEGTGGQSNAMLLYHMDSNMNVQHDWLKLEQPKFNDFLLILWTAWSLVVFTLVFKLQLALGRDQKDHHRYYLIDWVKYLFFKKIIGWFLLEWKL